MRLGIEGALRAGLLLVLSGAPLLYGGKVAAQEAKGDDGQSKIVDDGNNLEDEIARNHHRTGTQYYEAGRFKEAGDEFTKSYNLSKRPIALFNAYIAYRDAGQDKKAAEALRKYLAEAQEIDDRQNLQARLENLEARLAMLEDRDAELRRKEQEAEAARQAAINEQEEQARRAEAAEGPGVAPIILMGAGGALIVGGVITGIVNRDIVSEIDDNCPNETCPAGYDLDDETGSAEVTAALTDIFIFGGAAVAASGLIWYLVGQPDEEEMATASAYCTGDGCGAVVQGNF